MRRVSLVVSAFVLSLSALTTPAASASPGPQGITLLAQQQDRSSSSTGYRSSRGSARLIGAGVVLGIGAIGWVLKKLRGED